MPDTCHAPDCENPLNGKRKDAKYCSSVCKLAAYHDRRGTTTKQVRNHSICQRDGCDRPIPETLRSDAKYCSNACRQKVWHTEHREQTRKKRDQNRLREIEKKQKKKEKEAVEDFIKELMG